MPGTRDSFALGGLVLATVAAAPLGAGCGMTKQRPQDPGKVVTRVALGVRAAGRLPAPVQDGAGAAAQGGGALVIGGLDSADRSVDTIDLSRRSRSHIAGRLPAPLHDAAAVSRDGVVYLLGGGDFSASDAILRVAPSGRTRRVGRLPVAASDVAAATIGGTVYVVGGFTGTNALATVVAWHPGARARVVARLPSPLRYGAVTALGGRLVIAGGTVGASATRAILSFDPSTRRVRRLGVLAVALTHAAAATIGSTAYVLGGRGGALTSQRSRILAITANGRVTNAGRLPFPLSDLTAVSLGDRIFVGGGRDRRGTVHDELLELRPR